MRILRKLLTTFLVLVFFPLLLAHVGLQTVQQTVLNPQFARQTARASGVGESAPALAARSLARVTSTLPFSVADAEIEGMVAKVLPPDRLYAALDGVIDGVYVWLQGTAERPDLTLDLSGARQDLGPTLQGFIRQKALEMPACTEAQLNELATAGRNTLPPCRPSGTETVDAFLNEAFPFDQAMNSIPERVDLAALLEDADQRFWNNLGDARRIAQWMSAAALWSWLAVSLVLVLVVLLNLDRWYTPLGWIGVPILLAGATVFLAGGLARTLALPVVQSQMTALGPLGPIGVRAAAAVIDAMLAVPTRYSLWLAVIGVACLLTGIVGSVSSKQPVTNPPDPLDPSNA